MLDRLRASDFCPFLNEKFLIQTGSNGLLELELIEVTEFGSTSAGDGDTSNRRPFSIVFRGPEDSILPQHTYEFEHDRIGTFGLFIVPIGPDREGFRYEAVFA